MGPHKTSVAPNKGTAAIVLKLFKMVWKYKPIKAEKVVFFMKLLISDQPCSSRVQGSLLSYLSRSGVALEAYFTHLVLSPE